MRHQAHARMGPIRRETGASCPIRSRVARRGVRTGQSPTPRPLDERPLPRPTCGLRRKGARTMPNRINRAIELLAQDQAIYYDGPHSGHVLTYAQGREDAATWADYMNVGMEHGCFDMSGLEAYMRG